MKQVVILFGGKSGEHEVSLQSAASILRNIDRKDYEPILVGVGKSGAWQLQSSEALAVAEKGSGPLALLPGPAVLAAPSGGLWIKNGSGLEPLPCNAVFPVLHGTFGEDGTVQGFLEVADLPYVGAPVMGSALGMDKEMAKNLWLEAGLPIVPFIVVRNSDIATPAALEALQRKVGGVFGWPAFVKPTCAGSSVGTAKVSAASDLEAALRSALEWDTKAMIEPFINAREIECSVLGNGDPRAFTPGEVLPSHEFYDYEAKYLDPNGAALEVPARISPEQAERVRSVAVAAFRACEMAGMARVDFFIDKRTGEVLLNEINTIPGFTSISMYPRMCQAGGLAYRDLISQLIELAIERHSSRQGLRFSR